MQQNEDLREQKRKDSMYTLTVFNAKKTTDKVPKSPYSNKTYEFKNVKCVSLEDCVRVLSDNWILSNALNTSGFISEKNKTSLSAHRDSKNQLMVLDLDEIKCSDDYYKIRDYFKDSDYTCVLAKSKSFNGIDNFNIKGFMIIKTENTSSNLKKHVNVLQDHLSDLCKVDMTIKNDVSFHAPTYQTEILYLNESGSNFIDINSVKEREVKLKKPSLKIDNNSIYKCIDIYKAMGYYVLDGEIKENGSINFTHSSEKKSKGGFFSFLENPFIMHHNNESRTFSIWNSFKQTDEGKNYLKQLFKKQQEDNIIDTNNYVNLVLLNDRYIDTSKCEEMIDEFLETDNSVLKIKSAMGTGKSSIIDRIIEKTEEKVLIISNRISVAMDYSSKYNIKTYLDKGDDSWKPGENLIVQFDSLHKYQVKNFDIIILDEFMSILFQTRSELSNDKNYNLSKFFSILNGSKKIVLADAFLNGFENTLLNKKYMFYVRNDYRDKIKHYNYKHREMFFSSLVHVLNNKDKNESVTVSVMSKNALNAMEMKLTELGFNVQTLTAETPELRKKKIYQLFEQEESKWDVLLFSPTLTVGVSNLNNVKHHFHFDTGLSADVISSLQMVKRSRKATYLHTFLKESQRYNPTNSDDLDVLSNYDIIHYFNGRQSTLLIEIDDEGDFKLSRLGKFSNCIEAFYNILENNHANAFNILMHEQFSCETENIITNDSNYSFYNMLKDHKENQQQELIKMLNDNKECNYTDEYIMELRTKTIDLTDEERTSLILGDIKDKFPKLNRDDVLKIAEIDINEGGKFIKELQMLNEVSRGTEYIQRKLSYLIASSVNSIQNKDRIQFYSYIIALDIKSIETWYSDNDINKIDKSVGQGKKFKGFLKKLGYKSKNNRLTLSPDHIKYFKHYSI